MLFMILDQKKQNNLQLSFPSDLASQIFTQGNKSRLKAVPDKIPHRNSSKNQSNPSLGDLPTGRIETFCSQIEFFPEVNALVPAPSRALFLCLPLLR